MSRTIEDQSTELKKPFGKEALELVERHGKKFTYINYAFVQERLDEVFGPSNWHLDYKIIPALNENELAVEVELRVIFVGGSEKTVKSVGSTYSRKVTEDSIKSCVSSGMKKAAMTLGIGLYLSKGQKDESIPTEQQANNGNGNRPTNIPPPPKFNNNNTWAPPVPVK